VDEHEIRVIGSTEALHAVMTVGQNLRSSGPEWRARKDGPPDRPTSTNSTTYTATEIVGYALCYA
jgi:NADH:ubiquinone oxidoreductase subunit D